MAMPTSLFRYVSSRSGLLGEGLGSRISQAMIGITGLVVLMVGGGAYLASVHIAQENIANMLESEARMTAQRVEDLLGDDLDELARLSSRSLVAEAYGNRGASRSLGMFLDEQRAADPHLLAVALRGGQGQTLAESRKSGVAWPDVGSLAYAAWRNGAPRLALIGDGGLLVSAVPVRGGPDQGVVGVMVALSDLGRLAADAFSSLPAEMQGRLVNRQGHTLAGGPWAARQRLMLAQKPLTGDHQVDALGLGVTVGLPESTALAPIHRLAWAYAAFGLAAFMLAAWLARRVASGMVRPLGHLSTLAKAVAEGRQTPDGAFAAQGKGEIGVLAAAFQHMLEALHAAQADQEAMIRTRTRDLADTQRRLEGVLASIHDMIYAVDLDLTRCLYASPAGRAIFGVDEETLRSGRVFWLEAIHPEDQETYLRAFRQANFEGAADVVYRLAPHEGRIRWIYERFQMSFDEEGRPDHIDGVAHEITRRKESEQLRQSLEDSLRLKDRAVDASDNGTLLCDARLPGQPIVYANPAFERLNGYAIEGIRGQSWMMLRPDQRDAHLLAELRLQILAGRPHRTTLRLRRQDDTLFWCDLSVSPVRDPSGDISHYLFILTDVSERVESEQRYRRVVESVQEALFQTDASGQLSFLNPAWTRLTGQAIKESLGTDLADFVHSEDLPRLQAARDDLLAGRTEEVDVELRFNTLDARFRWVALHARPVQDHEERIAGIAGSLNDITERRLAEESLRLHDRAMAQSGNGIVISDMTQPGQPVIYVNPAFERITGYPARDALGRNCNFLQGEDQDQPGLGVLRQAIAEEREAQVVLRNYRKDGSLFWNELDIAPVRDAAGKVTHYIGVQNDITERREAERALEDQSRRLQTIFSLSPDGFVSFDADGSLAFVNPAFLAMTGMTAESLVGLSVEAFDERLGYLAAPGQPYPKLCLTEGVEGPAGDDADTLAATDILVLARPEPRVLLRGMRYSDSRQAALTLYFRDATREMEVDRMKSEFLSTAAHELRTPLASIMGFSELLLMREYDERRRRDMLETMHRQSRRLTNLLNELLDLARIEARRGKDFKRERLSLGPLLREVVAAFLVPDDPRVVDTDLPDSLPDVEVDRAKFQQALFNVLSNAFKYSPEGGAVRLEILEGGRPGRPMVGVRVADQGIGMTAEQLGHLFERFWRADSTGHIPGTGLGMALVKEIVELHGGLVEVTSEFQAGTRVTLWLPVLAGEIVREQLALAA